MKSQKFSGSDRKENYIANKLTNALFIIYLFVLFWILLLKLGVRFSYMGNRRVSLIPFESLISTGKTDISEIILNIVICLPLGVYAGVLFKRWTFGKKLLFFFLISLMVEGLQFSLRVGALDSTDILTNTSGGIIGLILFEAMEKLFNDSIRTQKIINIVAATGTILMISLLVLLKLDMLPVKYQ